MSTTIDQKVVEMQFNNANFERNVATSMSTLEKLKRALKFDGASKGLENIQSSANKVNFSGMSNGIDTVNAKFSYLQMSIQHQLNNIVDSAVNTGKRMISALTIDPVKTGLQEYETQINSVQTILANTQHNGTTLDEVNNALDELNTYADKTIYNFTQMTRNIGTFTAAGVDLKTSVESIQGIANLAAVSGSTSQQASTAMYQLSQALAAGKVSLMDWNSVVNAGMGGKVFQDALIRTSELLKTGGKEAINTYGSFRESLTKGEWLTTEVLTETLKQLSGAYTEADLIAQGFTKEQAKEITKLAETAVNAATKVKTFTQLWDTLKEAAQSGWTQTWELIIGDFNEAQELLTNISDVVGNFINKTSETRNNILGGALKSPWKKFIDETTEAGVSTDDLQNKIQELYDKANGDGSFDSLIEKEGSFEKACRSGAVSTELLKKALSELGGKMVDLSGIRKNLKIGDTGDDVKKVQEALKQLNYDLGDFGEGSVDGVIGSYTESAIKAFQEANNLKVTGVVDDETIAALEKATTKTNDLTKALDIVDKGLGELGGREKIIAGLGNIFSSLGQIVGTIRDAFRDIFPAKTTDEYAESLGNIIDKFYNFTEKLKLSDDGVKQLKRTFKGLFAVLDIVRTIAGGGLSIAFKVLTTILGAFDLNILSFTAKIGDMLVAFHDWILQDNLLAQSINNLVAKLPGAIEKLKEWWGSFKETPAVKKFVSLFSKLLNMIENLTKIKFDSESIKTWAENFKQTFMELLNIIPSIMKQLGQSILDGLDVLTGGKITELKNFLSSFAETPEMEALSKALGRLGKAISGLFSTIGNIGSGIWDTVVGIGRNIIEGLQNGIGEGSGDVVSKIIEVATNLINAFCDLLGIHSPSTVAFSWGKFIIAGLVLGLLADIASTTEAGQKVVEGIKEAFDNSSLKDTFDSVIETIKQTNIGKAISSIFDNIDWDSVFAFVKDLESRASQIDWSNVVLGAIGTGTFVTLNKILDIVTNLTEPLKGIGKLFDSFSFTMEKVGKAQAKNLNREALLKTALAIGVLVAAIAALVYVAGDHPAQIWNAVGVIVAIGAVLVALSIAMDKLSSAAVDISKNGIKIDGLKKSLASIGVAVLLMTVAVKLIAGMDRDEAIQGFAGLTVIMLGIIGFVGMCSLVAKTDKDISSFGKMMKKMAVAMLLMLAVIKIASMMDPADLGKGIFVIELLTLVIGQMGIANRIAGGNAVKFGKTVKKIVVAMGMMLLLIKLISLMDPADLIIGITVIEIFTIIAIEMGAANRLAGGNAVKFGGTMIKMAFAMALMAGVMKLISLLDPTSILKGLIGIQAFALLIAEMLFIAKLGKGINGNLASTIVSMSIAIGIMAGVCVLLSAIDIAALTKGLAAVAVLGLVMSAMMKFAGNLRAGKGGKTAMGSIIALTVSIGIMAAAVVALAQIQTEKLIASTAVLSVLMGMFGLMTKLASAAKASLSGIILMAVVMGMLAGLLYLIDTIPIESSIGTTVSLILLLRSLAKAVQVIGDTKVDIKSMISTLISMVVAVGIIAVIIGLLANLTNVSEVLPIAIGLSAVVLALSGALLIISKAKVDFMTAGNAALGMIAIITIIGAFMSLLGGLVTLVPEAEEFLNAGIPVLESIGVGIGKFVGGIIGGIGSGIAEQLPPISAAMKEFVNNFVGIDSSALDGVKSLAEIITAIGAASIVDGIAGFLNFSKETPIEQFASNAGQLVDAVAGISAKLEGVTIDDKAIEKVAKAGTLFVELANSIPSTGGVLQKIAGVKDLAGFGDAIGKYATEIQKINDIVNAEGFVFNSDGIKAFATVGGPFAELVNSIPSTDGWAQRIAGVKDLGGFGESIKSYASEIQKVNDVINAKGFKFNSDGIKTFATVGGPFAELVNSIPETGGWAQRIAGVKDLGGFGESISSYIGELKTVSETIGKGFTIDATTLDSVITAGTKLADLQSSLDDMGGVIAWFVGENDLGTFGERIGKFAEAMSKLKDGMGKDGIPDSVVSSVTNAGDALLALNDALPEEGWFDSKITMDDFSDYIKNFSEAIADFSAKAAEMDSSAIGVAINAAHRIKYLITSIADIDTSGVSTFTGIGTGGPGADGVAYKIAKAMAKFSEEVSGIDISAVNVSVSAAGKLRTLISNLTSLDTSGIENFKPQSIGKAMKSYANAVFGMDPNTVSKSISSAYRLRSFISSLSGLDNSGISKFKLTEIGKAIQSYYVSVAGIETGSISNSVSAAYRLKSFIASLVDLDTSGVESFKSAVNSLGQVNIGAAAKALSKSSSSFSSVGTNMISAMTKGIQSKSSSVTSAASSVANSALKGITSKSSSFQSAGAQAMSKFVSGISSKKASVSTTVATITSTAASRIRSHYTTFNNNGKYLGDGLVLGINSKVQAAYNAGYRLGQAAARGEKDGQKSNSPSKLTIQAGKWLGEGLVIGIGKMTRSVYKAGYELGDSAVGSISSTISKISDYANEGIDSELTIRPIMDLSDVESGVGRINGMFGDSLAIGASANLGAISSMMSTRNQNGSNTEVVSAINKLSKQLGNAKGNTYNVNGVTYDDGSNISEAVQTLIQAARVERRV